MSKSFVKNTYEVLTLKSKQDQFIENANQAKLKLRPKSSLGLWLAMLLPIAIVTAGNNHPNSTLKYNNATYFSISLLLSTILFFHESSRKSMNLYRTISNAAYLLTFGFVLGTFMTFMQRPNIFYAKYLYQIPELVYYIISTLLATFGIFNGFPLMIKTFPHCFSFGEACLILQGILLFIYSTILNLIIVVKDTPKTNTDIITTILQMGILGISSIGLLTYKVAILRTVKLFYFQFFFLIWMLIMFPLWILLRTEPILWVFGFLFQNQPRIIMVSYWFFCTILTSMYIVSQIYTARHANTSQRKVFHILAIIVFLPALLQECTLLYISSGCVLAFFAVFEMFRLVNIPPLNVVLQDGFSIFVDEKDVKGGIALSPIYLLVGLAMPLWIHPQPCDLTDSAGFELLPLLSGILTIGLGDTVASVVGMKIGRTKWKNSNKSIEGTLASMIAQHLFILFLFYLGVITNERLLKAVIAIIVTSLTEALTDQVDNLALPLLAYIILL